MLHRILAAPVLQYVPLVKGVERFSRYHRRQPMDAVLSEWWPVLDMRERLAVLRLVVFPAEAEETAIKMDRLAQMCAEKALLVWDDGGRLRHFLDLVTSGPLDPLVQREAQKVYDWGLSIWVSGGSVLHVNICHLMTYAARSHMSSHNREKSTITFGEAHRVLVMADDIAEIDVSEILVHMDEMFLTQEESV